MIWIQDRLSGGVQSTDDSWIGELGNSRQLYGKLTDFNIFCIISFPESASLCKAGLPQAHDGPPASAS